MHFGQGLEFEKCVLEAPLPQLELRELVPRVKLPGLPEQDFSELGSAFFKAPGRDEVTGALKMEVRPFVGEKPVDKEHHRGDGKQCSGTRCNPCPIPAGRRACQRRGEPWLVC
jgi:hypothetical protein